MGPSGHVASARSGRHMNVPVTSIPPDEAAAHFTWLAEFLRVDAPASSALTRELLGWQPTRPGLIEDLEQGHYFQHADPHHEQAATAA